MSADDEDGETRVSIHQPNFLPWTKLFDKVLASDVYIAYDSVQYTRSEFHSRQRITGRDGPVWLSVPVLTRGRGRQPLCAVELVAGPRLARRPSAVADRALPGRPVLPRGDGGAGERVRRRRLPAGRLQFAPAARAA